VKLGDEMLGLLKRDERRCRDNSVSIAGTVWFVMKNSFVIRLATAVVPLLWLCTTTVSGWTITLSSGAYSFNSSFASQSGSNGFFGPYNVDNSSTGGNFAPLNGWLGAMVVSGSDAGYSSNLFEVIPDLELNPAVRVRGSFQIHPYRTGTAPGATTPISNWECTRFGIFVDTPLGRITYGKLQYGAGSGLQFALGNRTEEYLLLETCLFGGRGLNGGEKLLLETGMSPEKFKDEIKKIKSEIKDKSSDEEKQEIAKNLEVSLEKLEKLEKWAEAPDATVEPTISGLRIGLGVYPWRKGSTRYWDERDLNCAFSSSLLAYVTYDAGPIECEAGVLYGAFREGPEAQQTALARAAAPPTDVSNNEGFISLKYFNGRFFFNGEADWYYRTTRYQSSLDGTFFGTPALTPGGGGSLFAPRFIESWRWMAECGGIWGPLKLSFLYAYMPGPDRRHGILIDRQPFIQEQQQSGAPVFDPYCNLLASAYNAGVNSFSQDMTGARTFGGRLDYAIACNLNVSVSLMHARRSSCGYGWGFIRPNPNPSALIPFGTIDYNERGSFLTPSPSIPENNLGWEVSLGLRWRLLEKWMLAVKASYWWPGKWFNYACVDKSVSNWDLPTPANNFGVNQDRSIDPVFGLTMSFSAGI
jgi:hypothetical protein